MKRSYLGFVVAAALVAGCANAPAEDDVARGTVTLTSITPDGASSTVTLTAAQATQLHDELARAKANPQLEAVGQIGHGADATPEFVLDTRCVASSLYLYDLPYQSGNMICFTDVPGVTATADLLKYAYPGGGSWAGNERSGFGLFSHVKSYWGGRQAAIGGCQDSVGHNPVSCSASSSFEMMPAYAQGNINGNLRTIVEYHPVE